jgi:myo-inositol-1(or 4)-monophosphatase
VSGAPEPGRVRAGDPGPAGEKELLAIANAAADAGAEELLERFGGELTGLHAKTTPTDPVSAADLAAEAAIRRVLGEHRPADSFLGEEGGSVQGEGSLRWVVDPLDGTVNYIYGIPTFAVSIACEDDSGAIVGVVLDPIRGERFEATRSTAPLRDGVPAQASACAVLASALVATGFAYDAAVRLRQARVLDGLIGRVRDIRRAGSAALDLCWCACGRHDAYYERGVQTWDIAAGVLICRRAGLQVRTLPASDSLPEGVLVAPSTLIHELEPLVNAVD